MRLSSAAARPHLATLTSCGSSFAEKTFGDVDVGASRQSRGFTLRRREDIKGKENRSRIGERIRETARDALMEGGNKGK